MVKLGTVHGVLFILWFTRFTILLTQLSMADTLSPWGRLQVSQTDVKDSTRLLGERQSFLSKITFPLRGHQTHNNSSFKPAFLDLAWLDPEAPTSKRTILRDFPKMGVPTISSQTHHLSRREPNGFLDTPQFFQPYTLCSTRAGSDPITRYTEWGGRTGMEGVSGENSWAPQLYLMRSQGVLGSAICISTLSGFRRRCHARCVRCLPHFSL